MEIGGRASNILNRTTATSVNAGMIWCKCQIIALVYPRTRSQGTLYCTCTLRATCLAETCAVTQQMRLPQGTTAKCSTLMWGNSAKSKRNPCGKQLCCRSLRNRQIFPYYARAVGSNGERTGRFTTLLHSSEVCESEGSEAATTRAMHTLTVPPHAIKRQHYSAARCGARLATVECSTIRWRHGTPNMRCYRTVQDQSIHGGIFMDGSINNSARVGQHSRGRLVRDENAVQYELYRRWQNRSPMIVGAL